MPMIVRNAEEVRAFLTGRQVALRSTADLVEQLNEQLKEVKAERDRKIKELDETLATMTALRVAMFDSWQRRENERLQ